MPIKECGQQTRSIQLHKASRLRLQKLPTGIRAPHQLKLTMGIAENIKAIGDGGDALAQEFFIYFVTNYNQHYKLFPKYKDVKIENLRAVGGFPEHVRKVVNKALEVAAIVDNPDKLAAVAAELKGMGVHKGLNAAQFKDTFDALGQFAEMKLGGNADKAGWSHVSSKVKDALVAAGM